MELRLRNVVTIFKEIFKIIFELDFDINNRDPPKGFFAMIRTKWLDSDLISRLFGGGNFRKLSLSPAIGGAFEPHEWRY